MSTNSLQELSSRSICVGIMHKQSINFSLYGKYVVNGVEIEGEQNVQFNNNRIEWNGTNYTTLLFTPINPINSHITICHVTIGIHFHWEQEEEQSFKGSLRIIIDKDQLVAINELSVEDYLESVVSSEMSANSHIEMLKAHAVVSRSWVYSQILRRESGETNKESLHKNEHGLEWQDRADHTLYDVCADDHCQRYQGITRKVNENAHLAVTSTRGMVLTCDHRICDARFSKCCGGISERYSSCWDDTDYTYLRPIYDFSNENPPKDLRIEKEAERWIRSSPPAFCNTKDTDVLRKVLNTYDLPTEQFYRWQVCLPQEQIKSLIEKRTGTDFGAIIDLIPIERGASGRIIQLKIVGTKKEAIVGKELKIRRLLSETHLYSSAFIVEKHDIDTNNGIPSYFTLLGAGWGHGVGMCQIGAAIMAEKGYKYDEILNHYYKDTMISPIEEVINSHP